MSSDPLVAEFLSTFARKSGGEKDILAVELDQEIWATVAKSQDEGDVKVTSNVSPQEADEDDDIFCTTEAPIPPTESGSRERRSAFLILRCLQGEGLL